MERILLGRSAAACVVAGLSAIALVMFVRRLETASLVDLPAGEAAVYAAVFALAATTAAREMTSGAAWRFSRFRHPTAMLLTLGFIAGLTTSAASVLACFISTAAAMGLLAAPEFLSGVRSTSNESDRTSSGEMTETMPALPSNSTKEEPAMRLVRSQRDGREILEGVIRFEIPAGENAHVLHVPLWPPLAADPTVTCELEEIDGRVRVPLARSHGFRIEIRLPDAMDEPLSGAVRFIAECPMNASTAA